MLCLCVLCKYANGNVYKHSVLQEKNSPYEFVKRLLSNWRAGASQPSRTTDTIFLYIYIFLSGEATYRITLYVLLNQRGARTSSISTPQLPENSGFHRIFLPIPETSQQRCSLFSVFLTILMASESPAATMESVDGTTPSTVSSRRSAEARGWRLERERARRRQRLASETAAERERRLSQRRARDRARRAARSSPTSETRLVQMGSVERRRRATETSDQRETRLAQSRINITCL